MTQEFRFSNFGAMARTLAVHLRTQEERVRAAMRKAARAGRTHMARETVPVAFGELRESLHVEDTPKGASIVADAPHAAAVEVGSRPHAPPLEPLIAWVRLRGAQGLLTDRQVGRLPGTTTVAAARGVASALRAMERGGALEADAPVQIARAIQRAIARRGTQPHWFARRALPAIHAALDRFTTQQLRMPL